MGRRAGFATKNIHAGNKPEFPIGAINTPIYASSTYVFPSAKEGARRFTFAKEGTIYSRWGNPTVTALEKKLAALEQTDSAIAVASGMNAITSVFFHFLQAGDALLAHPTLYGGTYQFFANILPRFGIKTKFVDFNKPEALKKRINKQTKIIYFETPTNPLLEIIDIAAISKIGKKNNLLVVMDNTFAPPYLQYPLKQGVDLVVHSLTKYINGHSDIIGGAIIGRKRLVEAVRRQTTFFLGGTMSPFTAFLVSRGLATLKERLRAHCSNAQAIAEFLEEHPKVEKVFYPGLPSHSGHLLAQKQMYDGFGGMLSFILKGGYKAGEKLMGRVKIPALAVSLGGVESLIEHPASMTHSEYSKQEREKAGIYDGLLRLSVGIEEVDDLIVDLSTALAKI